MSNNHLNNQNKIERLLLRLCPDGVVFKKLGEVAKYSRQRIDASKLDNSNYAGVDNLLQNKQGKTISSYVPKLGKLTQFNQGDILIGNIRPYLKKIWLSDCIGGTNGDVLVIQINDKQKISSEFLYYLLSSDDFFNFDMKFAKGAKMPRGDKDSILKYIVPLPPLKVQEKIVNILNKFTELEAELEARKKQYEYYRGVMLTHYTSNQVLLGDIAIIGTGKHDTKDAVSDGEYVFYARGRKPLSLNTFDFDENAIITAGDGVGVGKVFHFASGKYALHQRAYRIVPNEDVNVRFIYHYIVANFAQYLEKTSVHASVTSLRRPMFLKYPVLLPPLDEQARVASILDKFSALINDISIGLPAELDARRKQFEYYREQLLTFKELKK